MLRKSLSIAMAICLSLVAATGCDKSKIVTSTGHMGHRVDKYKPLIESSKKGPQSKGGVIYLGRDYETSGFGPDGVKFVFD